MRFINAGIILAGFLVLLAMGMFFGQELKINLAERSNANNARIAAIK